VSGAARFPVWRFEGFKGAVAAIVALLACVFCGVARGQSAPQMQVQVEATTVGLGDTVRVQLGATSAETMPADAKLGALQGFVVREQSSFPSQTHMNINGQESDRYTLSVTWTLEARRVGAFRVGPPTVKVGGSRYPGSPVEITVVAAGQAPARRRPAQSPFPPGMQSPFTFSPFDPWKGFMQQFDQDDQRPAPEPSAPVDPRLSLGASRGAGYFLHATVDKTSAVVGEAVTFSVYEYIDLDSGRIEVDDQGVRDADAADFVKHPLLRDDQNTQLAGYATAGGRNWAVKLVRRWALFPLHVGDLSIGPMNVTLVRPAGAAGPRTSETLVVHVSEPPAAGRPPGYTLGDVGRFSLVAQVSPREVDQGGAIGVHVEVSGTGNVPNAIATPSRQGVEWLTPETRDELGPTGHDVFGGKRTLDFVVRLARAGAVDLGELALPFWNPDDRRYEVARAPLGVVHVTPSAAAAAAPTDPSGETLSALPPPRDTLAQPRGGAGSGSARHADDNPWFWMAGIGAWPLAFGAAVTGRAAGRRVLGAWRARRMSPAAELRERLAAATFACDKADARTADAAIARALEAATVAHAGVSVRGAVGGEVADRLERAGIGHDTATSVAQLLRECEAARFAPDTVDIGAARDRWQRARGAIRGLEAAG
jgi:BatD DUF11 like domain